MKENQIIIILFLLASICSCKKDDDYPVTYTSNLILDPTTKVYVTDREVTPSAWVDELINHFKSQLNKLESDKFKGKVVVTFLSKDSVEMTIDNVKEDKPRSVHEINGIIYLEKQDTSRGAFTAGFKIEDSFKYKPIYYEELPSQPGSGYSKYTKYKECYFFIKKGGTLNIPMFDLLFLWDANRGIPFFGNNNSFTVDGLKKIPGVEVIVQEYLIEMR